MTPHCLHAHRAGESKTVSMELPAADLGYWDDGRNSNPEVGSAGGWVVDKGAFDLYLGTAGFTSWREPLGLTGQVAVV